MSPGMAFATAAGQCRTFQRADQVGQRRRGTSCRGCAPAPPRGAFARSRRRAAGYDCFRLNCKVSDPARDVRISNASDRCTGRRGDLAAARLGCEVHKAGLLEADREVPRMFAQLTRAPSPGPSGRAISPSAPIRSRVGVRPRTHDRTLSRKSGEHLARRGVVSDPEEGDPRFAELSAGADSDSGASRMRSSTCGTSHAPVPGSFRAPASAGSVAAPADLLDPPVLGCDQLVASLWERHAHARRRGVAVRVNASQSQWQGIEFNSSMSV